MIKEKKKQKQKENLAACFGLLNIWQPGYMSRLLTSSRQWWWWYQITFRDYSGCHRNHDKHFNQMISFHQQRPPEEAERTLCIKTTCTWVLAPPLVCCLPSLLCASISSPNSLRPQGLYTAHGILQDTGVGSRSLLQRICPTQGSHQGLLPCRRMDSLPTEPSGKPSSGCWEKWKGCHCAHHSRLNGWSTILAITRQTLQHRSPTDTIPESGKTLVNKTVGSTSLQNTLSISEVVMW